jgi:hypothetical protein
MFILSKRIVTDFMTKSWCLIISVIEFISSWTAGGLSIPHRRATLDAGESKNQNQSSSSSSNNGSFFGCETVFHIQETTYHAT